jgi:hypothetical protein
MFNPKYQLLIKKESFGQTKVVCLGSQLILIVNFLKNLLPAHTWYASGVEVEGKINKKNDFHSYQIKKIGDDSLIIQYCSEVRQFIWGDFLCINNDFSAQDLSNCEITAEDGQYRPVCLNGILLEIQAFDTSFFAIYSENKEIIKKIALKFNCTDVFHKDTLNLSQ